MRSRLIAVWSVILVLCFPVFSMAAGSGDGIVIDDGFSFDTSEFNKSPFHFGGYIQADTSHVWLDRESALYRLTLENGDSRRFGGGLEIQPSLAWRDGSLKAFILADVKEEYDGDEWEDDLNLFEGYFSRQINPGAYVSLGKTLVRWGKGYAWNPVNFVGRPKNPSDPDLALEGYWLGLADFVKSFPGNLKTAALTGVILPVSDDVNSDFGESGHTNVAAKIYLLLYDTDIDLLMLSDGSRAQRYGVDFSRNITSNFEVHGEWAAVADVGKRVIAADGTTSEKTFDAENVLAGVRYLASTETTFILEYFRNGEGYTKEEAADFYRFIGQAGDAQLAGIGQAARGYMKPNFMKNYLYLRASQKEPFGLLYINPAITSVVNIDDGSGNLIPEVAYTGVTNLELRFRLNLLAGGGGTEYGEKQNKVKVEVRARYFF